ncbi:DsbA family protein [Bradyrhizobium sp. LHD-71]|uniref:DsbA family protein n=1 Tax=Bradyrhizobium sp. LHD-71 TaxID=3072141 RepID=UPI00280FA0D7|nr:DsbA family protein [Bradyrhizobium sp. LHD-71]MDQ8730737.1 DsbA family protein [Bradyrhizobium sp. LHD-71]
MILTRREFTVALSATALVAGFSPLGLIRSAMAQDANPAELAQPVPLGDMALGPANAPVTIIEYASMSCGHCAEFQKTVFPKIKAEYIDTNKIRYIFREFPLDIKAAAGSMLARCVGKDDPKKYFAVVDILFATQNDWVLKDTSEQLRRVAKQAGMNDETFNACLANQSMLDAMKKGQDQAFEKFKVDSTPTFFVNGTKLKGGASFEDFKKLIDQGLKS